VPPLAVSLGVPVRNTRVAGRAEVVEGRVNELPAVIVASLYELPLFRFFHS
jgi:hypothetical protein